ncbi:alpha/beta fold hydrolase [Psychrobacter sp. 1Y1]|uniref:alpha/beta fold hydrolase n=1 Tax=Psychrobacter sp. 1Y1 TaxID=3453574 RepID=UPI003F456939
MADATRANEREYWSDHMPKLGADISRNADGVIHRTGVFMIPKAGHWVAREQPENINRYIVDFISSHS